MYYDRYTHGKDVFFNTCHFTTNGDCVFVTPYLSRNTYIAPRTLPPAHLPKLDVDFLHPILPNSDPFRVGDLNIAHIDAPHLNVDSKIYQGLYPLHFLFSTMFRPAGSLSNGLASIFFRLLRIPNSKVHDSKRVKALGFLPSTLSKFEINLDEWLKTLSAKQKKLYKTYSEKELICAYYQKHTKIFIKTDEVIPSQEKFVPRLVYAPHFYYVMRLGPFVKNFAKHLTKTIWGKNSEPFTEYKGVKVYGYYACGATTEDLSFFVNKAWSGNDGLYLMVMGDDTWALLRKNGKVKVIETDFSKFDATQCNTTMEISLQWLEKLGYSQEAQIWRNMYKEKKYYIHRPTGNIVRIPKEKEFFLTGEPGTSLRNSILNMVVSLQAIIDEDVNVYKEYGLVVKQKETMSPYNTTFLRCVFLPTLDGYTCIRLPSFLLKFGKSTTDPLLIYPRNWDDDRKLQQFVRSQWLGYGNMKTNWFYSKFHRHIKHITPKADKVRFELKEWQVLSTGQTIDDETFFKFMDDRYCISKHEMQDFMDLLNGVNSLPVVIEHPITMKLMRDY
jgi:hypothetical protein